MLRIAIDRPSDENLLAHADCVFYSGQLKLHGELLVTSEAVCFASSKTSETELKRAIPFACIARAACVDRQPRRRNTVLRLLGDAFSTGLLLRLFFGSCRCSMRMYCRWHQ